MRIRVRWAHSFTFSPAQLREAARSDRQCLVNVIYMWFFRSCKRVFCVCRRMPAIGKSYQAEVAGIIRTGS